MSALDVVLDRPAGGRKGHAVGKPLDISNRRFRNLTALWVTRHRASNGARIWFCVCDCGCGTTAAASELLKGSRVSCGCKHREPSPQERFAAYSCPEPNSGCILWMGAWNQWGYGSLRIADDRPKISAHRFAWVMAHGPIPDELCVLHSCDVPACVNVRHLFLGTIFENSQDMARKNRGTVSGKGLPYGVFESHGRFGAFCRLNGAGHYLGMFATADSAGRVASEFKAKTFGVASDAR